MISVDVKKLTTSPAGDRPSEEALHQTTVSGVFCGDRIRPCKAKTLSAPCRRDFELRSVPSLLSLAFGPVPLGPAVEAVNTAAVEVGVGLTRGWLRCQRVLRVSASSLVLRRLRSRSNITKMQARLYRINSRRLRLANIAIWGIRWQGLAT